MNYTLYWIKHKNHTDIKTQGYVGITKFDINIRFETHKKKPNNHLKYAFLKYGENIEIISILSDIDQDFSKCLEEEYRPYDNIGWNIVKGGGIPPNMKGKKLNLSDDKRKLRSIRMQGTNNHVYGTSSYPKSIEGSISISNFQKNLSTEGKHPFQINKIRKNNGTRLRKLAEQGKHPLQNPEVRKATSIRMKNKSIERRKKDAELITARNKITNSIEYICPYCNKIGKGPNMKRYHFNKCKLRENI